MLVQHQINQPGRNVQQENFWVLNVPNMIAKRYCGLEIMTGWLAQPTASSFSVVYEQGSQDSAHAQKRQSSTKLQATVMIL